MCCCLKQGMEVLRTFCVFLAFASPSVADLCSKCACKNELLDCSFLSLEHHFSDDEWNGTKQTFVSFNDNNIIHLKAFPKLPITKLSLTHNKIVKIDPACFKELQNITELDLSHNQLTSEQLTPSVFQVSSVEVSPRKNSSSK